MELNVSSVPVEVTLITRVDGKTWVGILIDMEIRTFEAVVCFTKTHTYHYFSYGSQKEGWVGSIYDAVIKILKNPVKLAEL